MKIHYDVQVDALYIEFRPLAPGTADSHSLSEDVIANYGRDGKLAGLEILDASFLSSPPDGVRGREGGDNSK